MTEQEIRKFITDSAAIIDSIRSDITGRVKVEAGKDCDLIVNDLSCNLIDGVHAFDLCLELKPKDTSAFGGSVIRKQVIKEIFPGINLDLYVDLVFTIAKDDIVKLTDIEECFNQIMGSITHTYGLRYQRVSNESLENAINKIQEKFLVSKEDIKHASLGEEYKDYDIALTYNTDPGYPVFGVVIDRKDSTESITNRCVYNDRTYLLDKPVDINVRLDSVEKFQEIPIIDVNDMARGLETIASQLRDIIIDVDRKCYESNTVIPYSAPNM